MIMLTVLKWLSLVIAIVYTFSNVVKAFRGHRIYNVQLLAMATNWVAFIILTKEGF